MQELFTFPAEEYRRNLAPLEEYVKQSSQFLHQMTGKPLEECVDFVHKGVYEKRFKDTRNPMVKHYQRDVLGNKDTHEVATPLTRYIDSVVKEDKLLAPSGTTYLQPHLEQSLISKFINLKLSERKSVKKAQFVAKSNGELDKATALGIKQTTIKLDNNSFSGLFNSEGSVLSNPSAHSSLTSTTRTVTSIGNTNNERLIGGNRHYWSPEVVLNNINSIVSSLKEKAYASDRTLGELVGEALEKYGLKSPTVDELIDLVKYSTGLYWTDPRHINFIRLYLERLSKIERAAFAYMGDLYHIRKFNDGFMRKFVGALSMKVTRPTQPEDFNKIKKVDEEVLDLVHKIWYSDVKGFGKNYEKMDSEKNILGGIVATSENIVEVLRDNLLLIQAFFLTNNLPPSIAYIPNMVRRVVVMSDTDSSCASSDEWVKWWYGEIYFSDETRAVANSIHYFATQCLKHYLAVLSANMGIKKDNLFKLAMKSEFYWEVFGPSDVAKTYFARTCVQEGNVWAEPEMEIKGVNLKNSNTPYRVKELGNSLMDDITRLISENKKISIKDVLVRVADLERTIEKSLKNGEMEFYRAINIKAASGYKLEEMRSAYQHYLFWQQTFEKRYGKLVNIPYKAAKVPISLGNPTELNAWLQSLDDVSIKTALEDWAKKTNKREWNTMYIPVEHLVLYGMPSEVQDIIDTDGVIHDLVNLCYIVLSVLRYHKKPGYTLKQLGY